MAKKKDNKKKKQDKKASARLSKQEEANYSKAQELRTRDEAAAEVRAKKYYSEGSLPRISAPAAINKMGPVTKVRDVANTNTNLNQSIAQGEQAYQEAQIRDSYVTDALNRMQAGLAGYNTPELQAMREQGRREIQSQGKNTERSLRQYAGTAGLTGQALASEMRKTKRAVQQDIAGQEVDLTVAQAAEQRARLGQYGDFSNSAYSTQANVKDAALGRLMGARGAAAEYALTADKANQGADSTNAQNEIDVGKTNIGVESSNITNTQATEIANAGQREKELAGEVGIAFGDPAVSAAYRDQLVQKQLAEEQIKASKQKI